MGSVDGGSSGFASLSCWGEEWLLKWSACWQKCSSREVWRSGSGNGVWLLLLTKEVAESGDCVELGVAGGGESIGDGIGDGIEAVNNRVMWCDSRDGEIVVTGVNCVGDAEGLGIDDMMAAGMLKGDANIESVRAAKVPVAVGGWLVVDDEGAAKWQERGGIVH
jgi:hypothetical protein